MILQREDSRGAFKQIKPMRYMMILSFHFEQKPNKHFDFKNTLKIKLYTQINSPIENGIKQEVDYNPVHVLC